MNRSAKMVRQTFTIARRDFKATVFTPLFLVFLLSPLIMISFGLVGGLGASAVGDVSDKSRIMALVPADEGAMMARTDQQLRGVFRKSDDAPPPLVTQTPGPDPQAEARAILQSKDYDTSAVLFGPLQRPQIFYGSQGTRTADYLAELAEQTLRAERSGGGAALSTPTKSEIAHKGVSLSGQHQSAFFAVTGVFFLTLFLAGQAVGTMAEERSNKVIEVLAAAVPLESVFLGKLLGMFGVAVLFVAFWGTLISQIGHILPASTSRGLAELGPATGFPVFLALFFAYFTMAYMLLGAVFLSVGAQASTMREIQMLSLPITVLQMAMFGFASAAASQPGSWLALAAELFPLSSPFAMAAHAANAPELWPHAAALAWQLLWVTITIAVGARAFRRGVLKSGGGKKTGFKALLSRR